MVDGKLAAEATDTKAETSATGRRAASSARVDEPLEPRGEIWALVRSVAVIASGVLLVGWLIG